MHTLHGGGAILEGLRPDLVTIQADGQARLTDLADLLPLPLPPNPPIRGTLYTAPELAVARDNTDARADLYSFGAMLYALNLGVDLTDKDFDAKTGIPKNFIARFPDVHPLFGRLITKTFCRDPQLRFPTDGRRQERPDRLPGADQRRWRPAASASTTSAWTSPPGRRPAWSAPATRTPSPCSTPPSRRQDDISEYALVILCDGMGGYEAGEVAARHLPSRRCGST